MVHERHRYPSGSVRVVVESQFAEVGVLDDRRLNHVRPDGVHCVAVVGRVQEDRRLDVNQPDVANRGLARDDLYAV